MTLIFFNFEVKSWLIVYFVPEPKGTPFFPREININLSGSILVRKVQAQKINLPHFMHQQINPKNISAILEISSKKSSSSLGVALSAFNLLLVKENKNFQLGVLIKGSKVFKMVVISRFVLGF
jgi:hypothetical protein